MVFVSQIGYSSCTLDMPGARNVILGSGPILDPDWTHMVLISGDIPAHSMLVCTMVLREGGGEEYWRLDGPT